MHSSRSPYSGPRSTAYARQGDLIQTYIDDLLVVAHTLQYFVGGVEAVAAYLGMMGMELNSRKCAMATTEGIPGLHLRLCPKPGKPLVLGADSGLRPPPGTPAAAGRRLLPAAQAPAAPGGGEPLVPQHPRTTQGGTGSHPRNPLGGAPFIADDSDSAHHLDDITVQVAKDRARASRDSLQDDRIMGLTRVTTGCQQVAVALLGTLVHHRSVPVRAKAASLFLELAGAHGICPEVPYPVPGGDWVKRIPRALAAYGVGLYNPVECFEAAHIQQQAPSGNVVTLRNAKLQDRDTCGLTVPHTTPWHGHHSPHHPFPDYDDPWPVSVRECLSQCADEHPDYCHRKQGPTDHAGWRDALVNFFHTTGTQDPRLRLIHPTRAKKDAHIGSRVTPDGLHLHVGGYRRQGDLSPLTQGAAYHQPGALMHILRNVLLDGEHHATNADVVWPEPLRLRPHAPAPVWLVTTDDQ